MAADEIWNIEKSKAWDAAEHLYRAQLKKMLDFFKAQ